MGQNPPQQSPGFGGWQPSGQGAGPQGPYPGQPPQPHGPYPGPQPWGQDGANGPSRRGPNWIAILATVSGVLFLTIVLIVTFLLVHKNDGPTPAVAPAPSTSPLPTRKDRPTEAPTSMPSTREDAPSKAPLPSTKDSSGPTDGSSSGLKEAITTDGTYKIDLGDTPWRPSNTPWEDAMKYSLPNDLLRIHSERVGTHSPKYFADIYIAQNPWKAGPKVTKQSIQQQEKIYKTPPKSIDGDPYPITIAGSKVLGRAYDIDYDTDKKYTYVNAYFLEVRRDTVLTLVVVAGDKKTADELSRWLNGRITHIG